MLRFAFELVGIALLAASAVYALRAVRWDATRFSRVAGLGTLYLAADDLFEFHEFLGRWIYEDLDWEEPPGINHFDDVFVVAAAVAGLVAIAVFWREIVRLRTFAALFALGLVCFGLAIFADVWLDPDSGFSWWSEEGSEFAASAAMALAFRWRLGVLARSQAAA